VHACIARPLRSSPVRQAAHVDPGVGSVLGYTIASEIGDIHRFATPKKLSRYTGLCPRVYQSGSKEHRGPLAKTGPTYLRWALIEAAVHAAKHPAYANTMSAPSRGSANSAARRWLASKSHANSSKPSGTYAPPTVRSPRQGPS